MPGRPPKLDPLMKLTRVQREKLVGGLLGDCWIELQKGAKNARIGLQLCEETRDYFYEWKDIFKDWLEVKATDSVVKAYQGGPKKKQLTARTYAHPEFTELHSVYRPNGPKLVPTVSWLTKEFTAVSFAELMMQDGSRHGLKAAAGFDIHSQGFTFEGSARLSILLNEKFGVDAWVTRDIKRDKDTQKVSHVFWTVYISCDSYSTMSNTVKQHMVPSLATAKFHPVAVAPRSTPNDKNQAKNFLTRFQNNNSLREQLDYVVPDADIKSYVRSFAQNPNLDPVIRPEV